MQALRPLTLVALSLVALALVAAGCGSQGAAPAPTKAPEAGKAAAPAPAQPSGKKTLIRYTHGSGATPEDAHQWTALKFKELVEKYSNGQVEVQIYPAGQLGSEQRGFQDVQNGVVEATSLAVNNATMFTPATGFYDLPYIFKTRDEAYKVFDGVWDDLNKKMIEQGGVRAIIWFEQGFRVLTNSKREVKTLQDLQGLKIRVPQNPLMIGAFKSWGVEPVPIAWDETFNALQQRVVDGQENPHPVNASMKFYEVQKYITEIHYKMWIGPVVVQEKWLQNLPPDVRDAVLKAGKEAVLAERQFIQELESKSLKICLDKGMVNSGPPTDEDEWMKRAMGIWPDFYKDIGGTEMAEKAIKILGRELPKKLASGDVPPWNVPDICRRSTAAPSPKDSRGREVSEVEEGYVVHRQLRGDLRRCPAAGHGGAAVRAGRASLLPGQGAGLDRGDVALHVSVDDLPGGQYGGEVRRTYTGHGPSRLAAPPSPPVRVAGSRSAVVVLQCRGCR